MREQHNVAWGQSAPVVATAAALWITGVVALPLIFGAQPAGLGPGLVWLGGGLAPTRLPLAVVAPPSPGVAAGAGGPAGGLAAPGAPRPWAPLMRLAVRGVAMTGRSCRHVSLKRRRRRSMAMPP